MADELTEIEREQCHLDVLYARLDELRARTEHDLVAVRRQRPSGTHQNRSERDAFAAMYEQRLAQLRAVEDRLCFGRFDVRDNQRRYVGRIGLSDDERQQLLIDWRAPAARFFYQATAASPGDVVRRRHLTTRGRAVVAIEDEVLDVDALDSAELAHLSGEGALLAALNARRTGRMSDIVATIQAEQDQIIRSLLDGILVVQGGPGTGKTAVALHRAAYLLYTYRERLERRGVLVVGPSQVFLRYIEKVLPSLGENGVVMASVGELFPGVVADAVDTPQVAALKGAARMQAVLASAVRARQRVPSSAISLDVEGRALVLRPHVVAAAQARARRSGKPHNLARVGYVKEVLDQLVAQYARVLGIRLDGESRRELMADVRAARDVRREINLTWMPLTPQRFMADLYANRDLLKQAAPFLSDTELDALCRPRGSAWTVADVPLLDEAAELLGEDDMASPQARTAEAERRASVEYARGALQLSGAGAFLSAEQLADRFTDAGPTLTTAERAFADRTWAYGHVVVDEAQELSPMAWRMLMRRCPTKSMTLVGDVAQTGSSAGADSWSSALGPHVGDRWRLAELTVNYRTPAQVMRVATAVLRGGGIEAAVPTSAREGEFPPVAQEILADDAASLVNGVRMEFNQLDGGKLAVICARSQTADVFDALSSAFLSGSVGLGAESLDVPVAVLSVTQAKGLEFDTVVLVEPARILRESPRGVNDLYVAITRPTQRLRVLHSQPMPAGFDVDTR